jgi:hypothetical protein
MDTLLFKNKTGIHFAVLNFMLIRKCVMNIFHNNQVIEK